MLTSEWAILTSVSKQNIVYCNLLETAIFEYQFIIANISMTVRRIISKSRRFIEIRCLFMLLDDN